MIYNPYPQYTSKWINVCMKDKLTSEQLTWLQNHNGGQYHIHNSQGAVKFELSKDAEWFILRWL